MITRSLKTSTTTTTNNNPSLISQDYSSKKRSSKKPPPTASKLTQKSGASSHKSPLFDCGCFECYTSYWFRWDSSPNRELIHQVIEAFEDHLTNGEAQKPPSKKTARPKRRDSNSRTAALVPKDGPVLENPTQPDHELLASESSTMEAPVSADEATSTDKDVKEEEVAEVTEATEEFPVEEDTEVEVWTAKAVKTTAAATSNHKGLARKVLPDVLGLFNSRLWGLWNPNV
ncbi:hypothetical protein PTKIN_Ptkin17bG0107600 [Pterospermum kingtungense]